MTWAPNDTEKNRLLNEIKTKLFNRKEDPLVVVVLTLLTQNKGISKSKANAVLNCPAVKSVDHIKLLAEHDFNFPNNAPENVKKALDEATAASSAKVVSFFESKRTKKVAACLGKTDNNLYYYEANDLKPIPPSVYLHEALRENNIVPKDKRILVNYPTDLWVNQNTYLEIPYTDVDNDKFKAEKKLNPSMAHWNQFSLDKLGEKPNLTSIYEEKVTATNSKARRIYMLATFCLLKKRGFVNKDKTLGHNIGTMLVSKQGEILAWGVNTGKYRHAEVNTLISYFLRNSSQTNLPVDSVLFSTLKPCRMCSTYISQAWNGGKTRIWYGMMDEGGSGSTPLLGSQSSEFTGADLELDVLELLSESGTLDTAIKATGTKPVQVKLGDHKVSLSEKLNSSGNGNRTKETKKGGVSYLSAADWVDSSQEVINLIEAAITKFQGKADKARDDGPIKRVLAYLKEFVKAPA